MSQSEAVEISILTDSGDIVSQLQIAKDETIENLKAILEVQTNVLLKDQQLLFNGKEVLNTQTIGQCGISNNDVLLLRKVPGTTGAEPPGMSQAQQLVEYVRNNPHVMQQLRNNNPTVADAVQRGDLNALATFLAQQEQQRRLHEQREQARIDRFNADPFDPEIQKQIEEEIRQGNIMDNMEQALEHTPESFARVIMLYVDCEVNGVPVKAFVDSGAQKTIMSQACAKRCNIERLIDTRYQGMAKGVGVAKITGRVHLAPIKLGSAFFPCSFMILENQDVEFLLGLDMLRRHQCILDLKDNVLRIADQAIPFLAEKDIPQSEIFSDAPPPSVAPGPVSSTVASSSSSQQQPATSTPASAPTQQQKPPTQAPPPSSQPVAQSSPFPEASIKQLTELGFSRPEVIEALRACNGNVDAAASYLFSGF